MKSNQKCKLILFTDIHYLDKRPEVLTPSLQRKLTQHSILLLDNLINKINHEYTPDASINLGDFIEDTHNHDRDIKNIEYTWNKLKEISTPFYSVIGNHDLRMMDSTKEVLDIMGYEKGTFSIDTNGYHLVFLTTEIRHELGLERGGIFKAQYISDEDIEWFKNDLSNNNLPSLIFTHFGLAEDDMEGNYWFEKNSENALLKNRDVIKKIIQKDENILAVFSGHQHWTKIIEEEGIKYYVLGSLTENINNDGVPDGIYFEVDLEESKISIKEHHLSL